MLACNANRRAQAVARHRATLFGPLVDDYLDVLESQGHPAPLRLAHLHLVTRFGLFLAAQRVSDVAGIRDEHCERFLRLEKSQRSRRRRARRSAAKHPVWSPRRRLDAFLRHLEQRGLWVRPGAESRPVIDSFYRSLEVERGLRPATCDLYRNILKKFLDHLGSDGSADSLGTVSAPAVDSFIIAAGRTYSRRSMGSVGAVVRAFLRRLFQVGVIEHDLSLSVFLPHFYALERLPCALPWRTVRQLPNVPDLSLKTGLRDRAILAVLVAYGVRPGEVANLRLEDIDWRHNAIRFRRSKIGRPLSFPLTGDVGAALLAYLREGRPKTDSREVFVRCLAPFGPLSYGHVVSTRVAVYLKKAGIESRQSGAGVIRHSLAVQLLRTGHPLKTVSDVLGHRDPGVAFHYTKLETQDLRDVALDAREVIP